jgi:polygalacturonase
LASEKLNLFPSTNFFIMTKRFLFLAFALIYLHAIAQTPDAALQAYIAKCPFPMPEVMLPKIPASSFNIKEYGALGDGKTLNTEAFEKTMAACAAAGGGIVQVPAGEWLTGPIKFRSNINLRLEKGALIQFTKDRTQYPMIKAGSKSSSIVPASPIYAYDCKNIAITGEGIIDGAGESWRPVKKMKTTPAQWDALLASGGVLSADGKIWWPSKEALDGEQFVKDFKATGKKPDPISYLPARDFLRPYMLFMVNCENILLEGVTIRNSPKFVFYPSRCKNLTMTGVTVFNDWWAQNGDGIDISACKNVIIYKCNVSCGDDAICMKSSESSSDMPGTFALENILIAACKVQRGHGGFVIGSNTDGGMRNIFVTDCEFDGTDIGIRVKSNAGRGGLVKDIYIDNIMMDNIIDEAVLFDTYYADVPAGKTREDDSTTKVQDKVPEFTNFYISNIVCKAAEQAISIRGLPQMPVHHIYFKNMVIDAKKGMLAIDAANLFFDKVVINPATGPVFDLSNTKGMEVKNGQMPKTASIFLKASEHTSGISIANTLKGKTDKAILVDETVDKSSVVIN